MLRNGYHADWLVAGNNEWDGALDDISFFLPTDGNLGAECACL